MAAARLPACSARATTVRLWRQPLAATAALTTIDVIEQDGLLANAAQIGALIRQLFGEALAGVKGLVDIRGHGLMIGLELDRPCGALVGKALEAGLLINVTAECVIRFLPPLIFSERDAVSWSNVALR